MVIFAGCFGGLWWRLGAGPINLEMATPWLAAAIEENIGHGNTVEVGGTQIERAGRIRIAVRIRDIVVRDRDHAIVASAPKAEVRLSGTALLMGRLRAESLNLVDAELAVRITPGRLCDGFRGRHRKAARDRRHLKERRRRIRRHFPGQVNWRRPALVRHRSLPLTLRAAATMPPARRPDCWPASIGSTA